jgi:hypothetical protein
MTPATLYSSIVAAGIPHSSHESDLYIPNTPEARAILARFPLEQSNATSFINQAPPNAGQRWLDVPFAYLPFWQGKQGAT